VIGWARLCACAMAIAVVAAVPATAWAQILTPHVAEPEAVNPHVVTPPPAVSDPSTDSSPADASPADGLPGDASRSAPGPSPTGPASGAGSSYLIPVCNIEYPCTREQEELNETLAAKLEHELEEKYGPFAGRYRQLEMQREERERARQIQALIQQFAGQVICPLYRKAFDTIATLKAALDAAGYPNNEVLQALENAIGELMGRRNCFTSREP
jgi:hypothetical protein